MHNGSENGFHSILGNIAGMAAQADTAARAVSGDAYTSTALFEHEQRTIFRREWQCVGRADEIAAPGDYFTTDIGAVPIIVVRQNDGAIHALHNICRHRLARIAEGKGTASRFVCPYHGWTYHRSGNLVGAGGMPEDFDKADCSLLRAKVEIWNGYIYVNIDQDAAPLAPRLEPLGSLIKDYGVERMQTLHRGREVWNANWKILTENFLESYHLQVVHSKTLAPKAPHDTIRMVADGPGYAFHTLRWSDSRMIPQDSSICVENRDLSEAQRRTVYVGGVFPNHLFTVAYDQFTWMRAQPIDVGRTLVDWGVAGSVNIPHGTKPDPDHPNLSYIKNIPLVNAEDQAIVEGVQRGAMAGTVQPGRLHPTERPLWLFARYLDAQLQQS